MVEEKFEDVINNWLNIYQNKPIEMFKVELKQTKDWTPFEIAKWHEKTFPDTTLTAQRTKWQKECHEFLQANSLKDKTEELADCYIVSVSMMRWDCLTTVSNLKHIDEVRYQFGITQEELLAAVNKKMTINEQRTWTKLDDGSYQHK